MKSYLLKLSGREEGPFSDAQIAQMFADQRVDRATLCKPTAGGDWRSVDDYLPTLKYGTQLPAPTAAPAPGGPRNLTVAARSSADQRVSIVDIDLPFVSILKLMFKWAGAGFIVGACMIPVFFLLWLLAMAFFASLIGGALSGLPHR